MADTHTTERFREKQIRMATGARLSGSFGRPGPMGGMKMKRAAYQDALCRPFLDMVGIRCFKRHHRGKGFTPAARPGPNSPADPAGDRVATAGTVLLESAEKADLDSTAPVRRKGIIKSAREPKLNRNLHSFGFSAQTPRYSIRSTSWGPEGFISQCSFRAEQVPLHREDRGAVKSPVFGKPDRGYRGRYPVP